MKSRNRDNGAVMGRTFVELRKEWEVEDNYWEDRDVEPERWEENDYEKSNKE